MAVGADDVALGDFLKDRAPSLEGKHKRTDVGHLGAADVIELKDDGITLATIDARVLAEVVEYQPAELVYDPSMPTADALTAQVGVLGVDSDLSSDVAGLAAGLPAVFGGGSSMKILERLPRLADGAHLADDGGMVEQRHGASRSLLRTKAGDLRAAEVFSGYRGGETFLQDATDTIAFDALGAFCGPAHDVGDDVGRVWGE